MIAISSVQFSHSVVSDSLRPHELQHARPPYPSPTPGVYSNPCPLSWWCHPAIPQCTVNYKVMCNEKWGPPACCSKVNKEARFVERLPYFGYRQLGKREDTYAKANSLLPPHPPLTDNQWAKVFIGWGRGHSQLWQSPWNRSSVASSVSSWLF